MVLVGKKAPVFNTPAVLGDGKIVDNYDFAKAIKGKYAVIVFYPLDFTFVCPSELIALDKRTVKLKELGVEVVSVSIDSHFTHNAWRNTPVNDGGIGPVTYTMVADINQEVVKAYDVQAEGSMAFRGTFIIDKEGIVRHQTVNDLPLGRNIDEITRMVEALQFHEQYGEVCPAGWNKGDKGMKASPKGVAKYLSDHYKDL